MSVDAVIDAVKRHPDKTELWLRPRVERDGTATLRGRRLLTITVNPAYAPQPGDEIWGNAHQVVISKNGTDHKFGRIMRRFDGTEEVLWREGNSP
jgi:hypothetical protein